jgi:hypothetical protein
MSQFFYPSWVFHYCAGCKCQLSGVRAHILCERCRVECGGYGFIRRVKEPQMPAARESAPLGAYAPWAPHAN